LFDGVTELVAPERRPRTCVTPQNGRNATNAKSPPCHLLLARLPSVDRNLLGDQGQLRSPAPVDESAFEGWSHPNMRPKAPLLLCLRRERETISTTCHNWPGVAPRGAQPPTALSKKERRLLFRARPAAQLMRESSAVATLGSGGDNSAPPGAVRGAAARPGAAGGAPAITHRPRACGEWSATDRSAGLPTGAAGAPPIPTTPLGS
jgi:hypothetical protein